MKKLWDLFDKASDKCYKEIMQGKLDDKVWKETYELLLEIIEKEASKHQKGSWEFYMLDDETDYEHDVEGWLEDYLDNLEEEEKHAEILQICEKILEMFDWKEVSSSDFKIRIVFSLIAQKKGEEALAFSKKWYDEDEDDQNAVQAYIRSKIEMKDMDGAKEILNKYIDENTECCEENELIFQVALLVFKLEKNKTMQRLIEKKIHDYEEKIDNELLELDDFLF